MISVYSIIINYYYIIITCFNSFNSTVQNFRFHGVGIFLFFFPRSNCSTLAMAPITTHTEKSCSVRYGSFVLLTYNWLGCSDIKIQDFFSRFSEARTTTSGTTTQQQQQQKSCEKFISHLTPSSSLFLAKVGSFAPKMSLNSPKWLIFYRKKSLKKIKMLRLLESNSPENSHETSS